MRIFEAAAEVLKDSNQPMHVNEIYKEVINRNLYQFGAKNPKGVLSQSIREKSTANPKVKQTIFRLVEPSTYELIK